MGKRLIQIKLVIMAVMVLFLYNQCGNPYQTKPTELQFTDSSVVNSSVNTVDSLKAFEDSVYKITRARCISCHTTQNPTHAHNDSQVAHDILINQFKVNFTNIPNSRVVAKIRDENHGCWSDCSANALEMQEAVEYWAQKVEEIEQAQDDEVPVDDNMGDNNYDELEVSIDAFENTVYQLTRQRCIGCHDSLSPRHASSDVVEAHEIVTEYGLINFNNIPNSRLVTRLSQDAHQCWNGDCAANAQEMIDAITAWSNELDTANNNQPADPLTTISSDTVDNEINNSAPSNVVSVDLSQGSITAPFVFTSGDDGYLWAPSGSGNNYDANANGVGLATYNFSVPVAGDYKMSAMVEAVPNSEDSFFLSIDNENFFDWHVPQSNVFSMKVVSRGSNNADKTWDLNSGNHSLIIKQREDGTKMKSLIVYPAGSGNQNLAPGETVLSYDLSSMLGINEQVYFEIRMKVYDDYSYKFWNPRILTTNTNIYVKNIKLLINGYYNPQHSAYTIVDKVATPDDGSLASHALLALKDLGENQDKISFKFEILETSN